MILYKSLQEGGTVEQPQFKINDEGKFEEGPFKGLSEEEVTYLPAEQRKTIMDNFRQSGESERTFADYLPAMLLSPIGGLSIYAYDYLKKYFGNKDK